MLATDIEFEKLKMLLDYTKFHLGVYLSLLGGIVAFVSSDWGPPLNRPAVRCLLCISVILLAVAGACGGVVGATAVGYASYKDFRDAQIGPSYLHLMSGGAWVGWEHGCFWTAVTLMVVALTIFLPNRRRAK